MITGYYCTNIFSEQAKELIEFYREILGMPFVKTDIDVNEIVIVEIA